MAITTQNLLDNYFDWLRKSSQVNHLDNATDGNHHAFRRRHQRPNFEVKSKMLV